MQTNERLKIIELLYNEYPKPCALGFLSRIFDGESNRQRKVKAQIDLEYLLDQKLISKNKSELYLITTKGRQCYEKEKSEMQITSELKSMIDDDIEKLNLPGSYEFLEQIKIKYQSYIEAVRDVQFDCFTNSLNRDAKKLQSALIAFKTFGYQNNNQPSGKPSIIINNENINTNSFQINISFNEVRDDIKKNTYLTDDQVIEIISKIDELEEIDKSEKKKKDKWSKVKTILSWLGTQGVDIAVKMLPLVLKLLAQDQG